MKYLIIINKSSINLKLFYCKYVVAFILLCISYIIKFYIVFILRNFIHFCAVYFFNYTRFLIKRWSGRVEAVLGTLINHRNMKLRFVWYRKNRLCLFFLPETKGFKSFKNLRKFACYCVMDSFEYSSETSKRGRKRVNPRVDKKIKSLLQLLKPLGWRCQ